MPGGDWLKLWFERKLSLRANSASDSWTRELAEELLGGLLVCGCCITNVDEVAQVILPAEELNERAPSAFVEVNAFDAAGVSDWASPIGTVLTVGSQSQIALAIVESITVDVIYAACGEAKDLTMHSDPFARASACSTH
jgi:hypothetical protein